MKKLQTWSDVWRVLRLWGELNVTVVMCAMAGAMVGSVAVIALWFLAECLYQLYLVTDAAGLVVATAAAAGWVLPTWWYARKNAGH